MRWTTISLCVMSFGVSACNSTDAGPVPEEGGTSSPEMKDAAPDSSTTVISPPDAEGGVPDGAFPPVDPAAATDGGQAEGGDAAALDPDGEASVVFEWILPPGFPTPFVPATSPMSAEKVELGRRLFYDERLSGNQTYSCATCHEQRLAFTDGLAQAIGSTGERHPRSSMSLANVAYATTLTWANPLFFELHRQAMIPLFSDSPIEMGLRTQSEIEERLQAVAFYVDAFGRAFPGGEQPVTLLNLRKALEAFQRTIISGRSPYDRWASGEDSNAMSAASLRGLALFNSERVGCARCHSGFDFSDHVFYAGAPSAAMPYHNIGLYDLDGRGAYPESSTGVFDVTLIPSDMGAFKAPTLRNIAITAPYMHDGSVATLGEVVDLFAAGGRNITAGPLSGDGRKSPLKDPLVHGFSITVDEKADLVAFLESLTDEEFLADPRFSDPWK